MDVAVLVPIEEYLATTYHPDCDYLEGRLVERNVGQTDHSQTQAAAVEWFRVRRKTLGITVLPECRLQVSAQRYRVPDVMIVVGTVARAKALEAAPLLCIEILSPDDRMGRVQERVDEYLALGVPYVWVIDPETRRAWAYEADRIREVRDGVLRIPERGIELPLAELFEEL